MHRTDTAKRFAMILVSLALLGGPAAAQSSAEDYLDLIEALCEDKWPGDYRMQVYCRDRQIEALGAPTDVPTVAEGNRLGPTILRDCIGEEGSGEYIDPSLSPFCVEVQVEVYIEVR